MACCRRKSPVRRISAPLGSTHRTSRSRQTALTIADRTGCIAWAVEGLLPTLADAAFAVGNDVTLSDVRRRLEHDATHLAHPIGAAWVLVIDGAYALRKERIADALLLLQRSVATREALPYTCDAVRTRLRLAGALQQSGALTEAKHEVREALQMLVRLGASSTSCSSLRSDSATRRWRATWHYRANGGNTPGEYFRQARCARPDGAGRPGARAGTAPGHVARAPRCRASLPAGSASIAARVGHADPLAVFAHEDRVHAAETDVAHTTRRCVPAGHERLIHAA